MSYKGNEYSFQIGAEINADVKALEKELKGLVGKMNANAEGTFTLNIDEAKQSLDTLLETVSKIKSNFDDGVKVNIDTQSAEEDIRQLYAKLEDVAKNKSGSDGFIIKDAVKLQSILERVSSSLEKMKKTKLGEIFQTKDLATGELKTVLDENGKAMTLYDKIVSDADSNLAKVEQAVKDLSQALIAGQMPIEKYRKAMDDLNKLGLALAEGDEAFNLNNVGNAKNNTADKSDQTMLYKELTTLKREENALTERSIKLSKEKNQAEISAVNEQLQAIQKRKAEINSEIIDKNLVGKFFEKDLLNIDEKGRTNLIDKTAKEFDSLNSMLDTQNAKISEAQANIEKYLVSFKNLTPEARAELESLKQLLESQKEDNNQAKSSTMEDNIASKDSELAQLAHKLNIESLQTKNTSLEVSKELLAMSSEMIRSMQLANKIEGETLAVQQKKAQLITMINGLQTEAQRYQTSFINEEDKTKAMAISEQIQKIKEEMSSINTENLTGEELVTAQKRFEENIRTVRNLSNELSNLNKNNVKIKAEIDFDGATRDAENKTKELGNKLSKEINQLGAFKLTNAYGNEAEIDSVIAQLRQLETEKKNLESQPITNKAELIEYQKNLTELNNKYKELKLSASSINIDASISKSFDKMTSDANSVVMKTREMEEAMHKASQQYKHIDTKQMQSLHTMLMQVRAEAEKVAKTKFDDFNAHTSTIALKNMNTQLKELGLGFTQVKNEAQSWDRAMGQFFDVRKVMAFTSQFTFLRQAISMVTREVQALDSAMTTLRITVDGTDSDFKEMTSEAAKMAKDMGTTYEKALSLLKTYSNATETISSTMAKIKPTIALSNISDMTGAEAVDTIQAILQQFNLVEKEAGNVEKATYKVSDAIVSISKSLKMDFSDGIAEIADGIKVSGSVMEQAGVSLESYSGMLASIIETTRLAGSQVGNAFKTIATRITKAETTDLSDEDVEAISKIEMAYKSVGVEIRKSATEFRNLDDILYELSGKWDTLTDIQKSNISYLSAGVRQTNIFKALMENMGRAQELTNEASEGYGATLRANEKYMDSYTGKMNTLKGVWQEFASSLVESGSIKTFIDMLTGLLSTLDSFSWILSPLITMSIPLLIGGFVNAALSAINTEQSFSALILKLSGFDIQAKKSTATNTALASSITSVGMASKRTQALVASATATTKASTTATDASSASSTAAGVAMAGASAGASKFATAMGVASKAVTAFSVALGAAMVLVPIIKNIWNYFTVSVEEAAENVENLTKKMEAFNETAKDSKDASEAIATITNALAKYGDIPLKNLPTEEVQEYKEAIDKLRSLYPELTSSWTTYADVKKADLDIINEKMEQNNKLEAQKMQIALEGDRKSVDKTNKELIRKAEEVIEQKQYIASLEKERDELEAIGMDNLNTDQQMRYQDIVDALPNLSEKLSSAMAEAEGFNEIISKFLQQAQMLRENGIEIDTEGIKTLNDLLIEKGFSDPEPVEVEVDLRTKIINGIDSVVKEIEDKASGSVVTQFEIDLRADMSAFKDAEKAAQDIYDTMQLIVNAQDELNQTGMLEQSTINSLAEHYSSIYGIANDRVALQQFLNSAYTEEEGHMLTQIDLMNQYYEAMMMNDSLFYQTKVLNNENFTNFAAQLNTFLVKNGGEQYTLDANNFENLAQFKIEALKSVMQWIQECGINEANLLNQTVDLLTMIGGIESGLTPVKFNMPTIKAPSRPTSTYKPPSTSTKKPSTSTKKEKEVEDLKLKINLFYKWEKAIQDVEHRMSKLDKVIKAGTGQQKVAAIKEQIELYKELAKIQEDLLKAQREEEKKLRTQISNHGFRVEKDGTVVNYTQRLQELEKWANSATGDEKEARKKKVQEIKELLDDYVNMVKDINSTELEVDSLNGNLQDKKEELEDYYNELLDVVSDTESEITNMIKKELDKRKEALVKNLEDQKKLLQKAKDAFTKENKEEDYRNEHNEKKQEIAELQQALAIAMKDQSLAGKKAIAQLQEQLETAKKELADMERDKAREDQENWFDEEMDRLEEEQEKLEEEWDKKYNDEYIANMVKDLLSTGITSVEGEVVTLTSLVSEHLEGSFSLLGDKLQSEFLDKLEEAKEIASNLSGIFKELNVNLNPRDSLTSATSYSMQSAVASASAMMGSGISSYLREGVKAAPYENNNSMSIGSLLNINGNVDRNVLPNLEDIVNKAVDKLQANMRKQLRLGTGRI